MLIARRILKWARVLCVVACLGSPLSLQGCGHAPPRTRPRTDALPAARLPTTRVTTGPTTWRRSELLNFEVETDRLFLDAVPGATSLERAPDRSGQALRLPAGTERVNVKLATLMSGRAFPGEWTLLSVSLYAEQQSALELSYQSDGAQQTSVVNLPASQWTRAMLDLSTLTDTSAETGTLRLRFRSGGTTTPIWIDDVALLNNAEMIFAGGESEWSIWRRGLRLSIDRPRVFALHLATTESPTGGWSVVEANALRARFHSNRQSEREMTVYSDGRVFKDGAFSAASAAVRDDPRYAGAHEVPATIEIDESFGRVIRNSPGDTDNDGYNEHLGAYVLGAAQNRLQIRFVPSGQPIARPVLQISGLPKGNVRIHVEGRYIDHWQRLDDGQVLVVLPLVIERATTINVRLE